jgi:magnesium transporter
VALAADDVDELELLTRPGSEAELRTFLLLLHPADLAELVDDVQPTTARAILQHLEPERAAKMLAEVEPDVQEKILRITKPDELAPIVNEMATDDVADLLQEVDERTAEHILATLPIDDREDVARLLEYDPESAGGIMQTELVSVPISSTVASAIEAVREAAAETDIISVFVVDDAGRYAGHVALQDLVLSKPDVPIESLMDAKVVEVTPDVDQEEVARIFDHYSLVELGVVDPTQNGRLIGRITADDVHEVLVEEAGEDMLKIAGTVAEPEEIYSEKTWKVVRQRLPWLGSTFIAGLVATWILNAASVVFDTAIVLLTFVPVITGMSGNVGTQSAMIMIRGMAVGHVDPGKMTRTILRDVQVSAIMGLTCGLAVTVLVTAIFGKTLGPCVGISLMCSMTFAGFLGSAEPPLLQRFGVDPAVAAGPLITSLNDITGVLIYTLVSILILSIAPLG